MSSAARGADQGGRREGGRDRMSAGLFVGERRQHGPARSLFGKSGIRA
jgi:hypothetical protein